MKTNIQVVKDLKKQKPRKPFGSGAVSFLVLAEKLRRGKDPGYAHVEPFAFSANHDGDLYPVSQKITPLAIRVTTNN
jgi:hypothetical protein